MHRVRRIWFPGQDWNKMLDHGAIDALFAFLPLSPEFSTQSIPVSTMEGASVRVCPYIVDTAGLTHGEPAANPFGKMECWY